MLLVDRKRHRIFEPGPEFTSVDQQIVENQDPENETEDESNQVLGKRNTGFVEKAADANTKGRKKIVDPVNREGETEWFQQSIGLIDKAMTLNPQISAQYHIPAMLNYYRQGEFDQAYARSLHIETPGLYWEPLFRAAVLGQLGRKDDASIYVNRLLAMQPTFENQAQELMRRLLYSDENVDMIARGLKKAGLSIKSTLTVTPLQTASKLSK